MNWKTTGIKGLLGVITFIVAYIATNPTVVTQFIPEKITTATVGSLVAGLLVALANWLKHKSDPQK